VKLQTWAILASAFVSACAQEPPLGHAASLDHVYVGTHSHDLYLAAFDPSNGALRLEGPVATLTRPTWAVRHPGLPVLYVANEVDNAGDGKGSVRAYTINSSTGALNLLNEVRSGGGGTTHLWLDAPSHTLLAANYGSGSLSSISILPDGRLGSLVSNVVETGSGPSPRQRSAHAHGSVVDPTGRYAIVADLGADRFFVYPFDRHTGALSAGDGVASLAVQPGSGPRHLAFGPHGHILYAVAELTAELLTLSWDAGKAQLSLLDRQSLNSPDHVGDSSASEILVSRDGGFVYVGNRGENTLLVYKVARSTGLLTQVQRIDAGGLTPWSFAFDPSGRWLLVAQEKSGKVNVFRVDGRTGQLVATSNTVSLPSPVSLTFDYPTR
jgi:6-phosphogluconolactonase